MSAAYARFSEPDYRVPVDLDSFVYDLGGTELCTAHGICLGKADDDLLADVEWQDGKLVLSEIFRRTYHGHIKSRASLDLEAADNDEIATVLRMIRRYFSSTSGQNVLRLAYSDASEEASA